MIAKFNTEEGWRYFDSVQQAQTYDPVSSSTRSAREAASYDLTSHHAGQQVRCIGLRTAHEGWVDVYYDREAYLCTDKGETINAI